MQHKFINPTTVFNSLQYGFSQAVVTNGCQQIFLSGQVATDENQNTIASGMGDQTRVCLENIEKVLIAAGSCKEDIAMLRIYIKESANTPDAQNEISHELKNFFGEQSPASSWVVITALALPEWLIEIEAQAVVPIS